MTKTEHDDDAPAASVHWFPVDLGEGVVAGFTGRAGGRSTGDHAGLNLGLHVGDDPGAVAANRRDLAAHVGLPVAFVRQVHGTAVLEVDGRDPDQVEPASLALGGHDAAVLGTPGTALGVLVADCVPVIIADPVHRRVAVAHAGRPGLLAGVLPAVVGALRGRGSDPADLRVAVGPCAGPCCYEVPAEMQAAAAAQVPAVRATTRWGTPSIDLRAGCHEILHGLGVTHIRDVKRCTIDDDTWYSYRRSPVTGRFAGVIGVDA